MQQLRKLKIALLCGGPSKERGISLNSARSVCDHLHSENVEIIPFYISLRNRIHRCSRAQLYSNTPDDFEFKIGGNGDSLNKVALSRLLRNIDLIFPVVHGTMGEDGQLQRILETIGLPFIGSSSKSCRRSFDKFRAREFLQKCNYYTIPTLLLKRPEKNHSRRLQEFFRNQSLKRAVVKPANGGSSINVFSVSSVTECLDRIRYILTDKLCHRIIVEPFCLGTEFTVIIIQNCQGKPVALIPNEIETDYSGNQIFDYRRKYLPTQQVTYHCPPRFPPNKTKEIQCRAEQLFSLFELNDFARFDGWLLPDGKIWFSDINPICGMEQNSFLFMQAARIGLSHRNILQYVLESACQRQGIPVPKSQAPKRQQRIPVDVVFGGDTSERQVSVMSGTNVWLKLINSRTYEPRPCFLDQQKNIWILPYAYALNHTTEEIATLCRRAETNERLLAPFRTRCLKKLDAIETPTSEENFLPEKSHLADFVKNSPGVFIALHGGIGENGTLQSLLEKSGVPFSGCPAEASQLCMDKVKTAKALEHLRSKGISTALKMKVQIQRIVGLEPRDYQNLWKDLREHLQSETLIAKPIGDGCSAGIARLFTSDDLKAYCQYALQGAPLIPDETLQGQMGVIEMPTHRMQSILFEEFIETDRIEIIRDRLHWKKRTGWIETTVGVLQTNECLRAFSPSLIVAEGNVLSLEEKFQGGTGINITPPPSSHVSQFAINRAKARIEQVASVLGIRGFARIDAFMNVENGKLIIIEANTVPGLTPSTVLFQQALTEIPSLYPVDFLEKILDGSLNRVAKSASKKEFYQ
ncbi:MAG: D-alanine--D-alanine ligase A [Candidatus Moanabacter tarae]|uniref:D-alanine--D-alanine ligase n=1 Tax=Candidatus Moanibacter tarae TaxID=2200854 RepID=A0A2Z4AE73_9BACT|nr:MAG: D-alanine--D-alanine ligase A [Candidatus Moanabacter tarae]